MYQPDKIFPLPESLPVETVREPWRQVLLDAAELIRVRGLAQGLHEDCAGRVCLHGAISIAVHGRAWLDTPREVHRALSDYFYRTGEPERIYGCTGFAEWNNAPGRTAAEVIHALEGAARSALREGG